MPIKKILFPATGPITMVEDGIRRIIGFSLNDLIQEDWHTIQIDGEESWTQAIGRGAKLAGFEGLLTISVNHRLGKNIVIFPDNLAPTSNVELMSEEDLIDRFTEATKMVKRQKRRDFFVVSASLLRLYV